MRPVKSMLPQSPGLLVIGVNHRTAPLPLRETLAFNPEQATRALNDLLRQFPGLQAVILSTCNRVEIYLALPSSGKPTPEDLHQFLAQFHALAPEAIAPHLYHHQNNAVAQHLFAVASSLDSMVVGETQILAQVKAAYQHARDCQSVGKLLHALFQRAFAAAKDVHENTNLSAGRLSVATVAVDLAQSVFDRFDDKTVVCIGAGKMATLMLKHLAGLHPKKLLVTNRSLAKAQAAAEQFAGEARPIEELTALLTQADILLTSTGAAGAIITEPAFKALLKARRYRPIVMVDIAVPRDIEAAVGQLPNVYLYNVDDLQEVAAGNKGKRDEEIAASRTVLDRHVAEFLQWSASQNVGPVVKALYERCHEIARAELKEAFSRNPNMTAEQRNELERLTHRLVGKILHAPVTHLTAPTTNPQSIPPPQLSAALKELFGLEGKAEE
jgi:glutamyl-tRNA reductase